MAVPYVEEDCTFTHEGRAFTSGGSSTSEAFAVAYVKAEGARPYFGQRVELTTWHGETIGTGRITGVWRTPRAWCASHAFSVEAKIDGRTYTGRAFYGFGGLWRGRRVARELRAAS